MITVDLDMPWIHKNMNTYTLDPDLADEPKIEPMVFNGSLSPSQV